MAPTPREPLSRQRIATTALGFTDEHGLAALSMRKLGAELGVEAMSLYNHVANKDGLYDAMCESLYGEVLQRYAPAEASWRESAFALVSAFRAVALEHPNAVTLMLDRPIPTTTRLEFLRSCYEVFCAAGFPTKEAALAFEAVASWVTGSVRMEIGMMARLVQDPQVLERHEVAEELRDTFDFMSACAAWTPEQHFAFGFETLMDGLEKRLAGIA